MKIDLDRLKEAHRKAYCLVTYLRFYLDENGMYSNWLYPCRLAEKLEQELASLSSRDDAIALDVESVDSIMEHMETFMDEEYSDEKANINNEDTAAEIKDRISLNQKKSVYPTLYNTFRGPFKDNTETGRYSIGGISDAYGNVFILSVDEQPYIKELHQHIVENLVDILNGKEVEWEGPRAVFNFEDKTIEVGFMTFTLIKRIGKNMYDESLELFHDLAFKILDKEDYVNFCKSCIPSYINNDRYDVSHVQETLCYDVADAAKVATTELIVSFMVRRLEKMTIKEKIDFTKIILSPNVEELVRKEYTLFFSKHLYEQAANDDRLEFIKTINDLTGFDDEVIDCIGIYYDKEKMLFLTKDLYDCFLDKHKRKETDIVIPKINISEHCYCIQSIEDLKSFAYDNYVVETDENIFWSVFQNGKYNIIHQNTNGEYVRLRDYVKTISMYFDENGIKEFTTGGILPLEFKTKRRMIDIANYTSACLFIMTGIAIAPGRIKYALIRHKQELVSNPELDSLNYFRNIIDANRSCLTIDERAIDSLYLSDETIKALFVLDD